MRAISREASAKRIASFCESFSVGSTQSIVPTSPSALRSSGTGDGELRPNNTRIKLEYSCSPIFCIFSMAHFILE